MIPINFFGTHEFAAGILDALIQSGDFNIKLVITAPDKPVGRKQEYQKPPVKILAEQRGLALAQPETLKNYALPDNGALLNVVCQYGQIIPRAMLDATKHGSVNVHTSLLPKYRGASPIQAALMAGDRETGVTIIKMDEKLDHGPILAQERVNISDSDTYPTLAQKLLEKAKFALVDTAKRWVDGQIDPVPQNDANATFCGIIGREEGKIGWANMSATKVYNLHRALTPWPGIWTTAAGKRLKLIAVKPTEKKLAAGEIRYENDRVFIGCATGAIEATELQIEGKKPTGAKEFINGHKTLQTVGG